MLSTLSNWLGAVSSPSKLVKRIVPFRPVTGPNEAARSVPSVENSPVEVTVPSPRQLIRPWPVTVPLTSATTPSASRVSWSGWMALAEPDSRHVEQRLAIAGRQAMGDRNVGHLDAACRMAKRAAGADHVIGQPEGQVVAGQRIESRQRGQVGHRRRALDRQRPATEIEACPWHRSARSGTLPISAVASPKVPGRAALDQPPVEVGGGDPHRRLRLAQPQARARSRRSGRRRSAGPAPH